MFVDGGCGLFFGACIFSRVQNCSIERTEHCIVLKYVSRLNRFPVVDTASRDYCLYEVFNATCRPGKVIMMTSAVYGRMRLGRCINNDFNIGCSKDVVVYFDSQCTGRRRCVVSLRNLVDVHPCQRDFMSYLEAGFTCVPGRQSISITSPVCRMITYDDNDVLECLSWWLSGLGHSACWPDGLRAFASLSSTPGLKGSFSAHLG